MSMGYGANFAETVSIENLAKVVGDNGLVDSFAEKFNKYHFTKGEIENYYDLAQTLSGENPSSGIDTDRKAFKSLQSLWDKIAEKFKAETGIDLYIGYHDAGNEGDCYDDVDGLYFNVSHRALYQPTKAYKAMMKNFGEDIVEREFFVSFG